MSVLLDEETVVIDDLDFTITCEALKRGVDRCGEEASHQLICTGCTNIVGVTCIEHAVWVRHANREAQHAACGERGRIRDIVEVVPL